MFPGGLWSTSDLIGNIVGNNKSVHVIDAVTSGNIIDIK